MNVRYNAHLNKYIFIKEGEEFCPRCDGKGIVPIKGKPISNTGTYLICSHCFGAGKLDWVEKVMGKNFQ